MFAALLNTFSWSIADSLGDNTVTEMFLMFCCSVEILCTSNNKFLSLLMLLAMDDGTEIRSVWSNGNRPEK